jgi:lysophospholipase L1-like esterase
VPEGKVSPPRVPADVPAYDAIAQRVMEENSVTVNDLYGFALARLGEIQIPVNVHFTPAGSEALAERVAAAIEKSLPPATNQSRGVQP